MSVSFSLSGSLICRNMYHLATKSASTETNMFCMLAKVKRLVQNQYTKPPLAAMSFRRPFHEKCQIYLISHRVFRKTVYLNVRNFCVDKFLRMMQILFRIASINPLVNFSNLWFWFFSVKKYKFCLSFLRSLHIENATVWMH